MILYTDNMELTYLLLTAFVIMLASLVGTFFVSRKLSHWADKNINYLIAFASGVFLIVVYDLIFEAIEFSNNLNIVIISVISGFLFFFVIEKIYPESHCHHSDKKCVVMSNKRGAQKVLVGDALHNFGDGILLAPVFLTDLRLGIVAGIGIFVHELVQEISEFFVLKKAGYNNREALSFNFLSSSAILFGALGGFYLTSFEYLIAPLVGVAAGAFLYILLVDLIPESIKHSHKERKYFNFAGWTLFGVLLILSVNLIAKHQLDDYGLDDHGHLEEHHDH